MALKTHGCVLFLQRKALLSRFRWCEYRRCFYRSRSTPEGQRIVRTPGAKWDEANAEDKWRALKMWNHKNASHNVIYQKVLNVCGYVLIHIFGSSWQRKFPWRKSQSLDLCDVGSGQYNIALLQGTELKTGLVPALLLLGIDTPLPSLHKQPHKYRINNVCIII